MSRKLYQSILVDPRYGNHTLYNFAKFLNETEICNMIEDISIKLSWIEKQVLIKHFEALIGQTNIPGDIHRYMLNMQAK